MGEESEEKLNVPKSEDELLQELVVKKYNWYPAAANIVHAGIPFLKTFKGQLILVLLFSAFVTILIFEKYFNY